MVATAHCPGSDTIEGITSGRAKSVLIPTKIEVVRTLRTSGKTIAYIVQNQAMSRVSVYRALEGVSSVRSTIRSITS